MALQIEISKERRMIYGKMWIDFTQTPAIGRGYLTSQADDPRLLQFRFPSSKVSDAHPPIDPQRGEIALTQPLPRPAVNVPR
jgi:hypothetical protein